MHARVYKVVSTRMRGGLLALLSPGGLRSRLNWVILAEKPGVRPTRPNTRTWQVQKGRPL